MGLMFQMILPKNITQTGLYKFICTLLIYLIHTNIIF